MSELLVDAIRRRARAASLPTAGGRLAGTEDAPGLSVPALDRAEEATGCTLPPLLRDVYMRIGNGGFGPGYGLLPLSLDDAHADQECALDLYVAFRSTDPDDSAWGWPAFLVPFCDWGCA